MEVEPLLRNKKNKLKMNEKVFLVGNDINNILSEEYSWERLLTDLVKHAKIKTEISSDNKPFPLFYEEIFLESARINQIKESNLKSYIAKKIALLKPNEIHKKIVYSEPKIFLTTNYDLTLEKVLTSDTEQIKNMGFIDESLYNIFRKYEVEDYCFWHIHGSQLTPRSITLGYEHYGGYLQQMRNYVVTGSNYKKKNFKPLIERINNNELKYESWVDYFFTHNIDIFGLKLDFVEMHLWWLLTYRSRVKINKKIQVENKIRYFYPKKFKTNSEHKLQLFKVNEVETIPIDMIDNDRLSYYNKVLNYIDEHP
jgi:hypothetical protein